MKKESLLREGVRATILSLPKVTPRQKMIIYSIMLGYTRYDELAERLGLGKSTINHHMNEIHIKLDVQGMADIVVLVCREVLRKYKMVKREEVKND